jgi:DNA-directed RNA polymerase specialized sigma24 family protein
VSIDRVTDDELVALARQDDAASFGELVSRHQAAVYRAALAAVGSPSDADDVAQEAFLLAYTRLRSFWNQAINQSTLDTR